MSRPGIEPGPPAWEAITQEKIDPGSLRWLFVTSTYEPANVATEQIFGELLNLMNYISGRWNNCIFNLSTGCRR